MKTLFGMTVALLILTPSLYADNVPGPESCGGQVLSSTEFVNGNCFGMQCNATLPGGSFSVTGSCPSGVTVQAQGFASAQFLNFICNGGSYFTMVPGQSIPLSGTCSNGASFSGSVDVPGETISGFCRISGPFSGTLAAQDLSFSGTCAAR